MSPKLQPQRRRRIDDLVVTIYHMLIKGVGVIALQGRETKVL